MSDNKPLSVWNYKPWWCQPWSILLTGIAIISGSWLIFQTIWLTVIVSIPVLTWMGFFIIYYPQSVLRSGMLQSLNSSKE